VTLVAFPAVFIAAFLGGQAATGRAPGVVVNAGRYGPYYHLRFALTAESVDFANSDRRARSGGQFELRLRSGRFPIPAPRCRGSIILRMPWTSRSDPNAPEKIRAKQALLQRIRRLERGRGEAVSVVLELNPYVQVLSTSPLELELTECNVFFRHASGGYVDHTDPLPGSGR
jgi:hypothetical protein